MDSTYPTPSGGDPLLDILDSLTPTEALARIAELESDLSDPAVIASEPDHLQAMREELDHLRLCVTPTVGRPALERRKRDVVVEHSQHVDGLWRVVTIFGATSPVAETFSTETGARMLAVRHMGRTDVEAVHVIAPS